MKWLPRNTKLKIPISKFILIYLVIHFLCPLIVLPIYYPFSGFHIQTPPSILPEASIFPSGDQDMHKTQLLCALHVNYGVSVLISQNLTVVSPNNNID